MFLFTMFYFLKIKLVTFGKSIIVEIMVVMKEKENHRILGDYISS